MRRVLFSSLAYYFLFAVAACAATPTESQLNPGKQVCPEEWYRDEMPSGVSSEWSKPAPSDEYFIIDGNRQEITGYDLGWIRAHCPVNQPSIVQ